MSKDIFISYRNDGCSNQFAHRLANDLTELGYCEPDVNKAYELYERAYSHGIHYASTMMRRIESLKGGSR